MMTAREIADLANLNATRAAAMRHATPADVAAVARAADIPATTAPHGAASYSEPDAVVIYATVKAQIETGTLP